MAVKTTKIQCNQDVDLRGKADIEGKVTCGNDVEVDGKLTINSAKDLVTKDGTSFGGGGLPSPWAANEKVLGYEDTENKIVVGFLSEGGSLYGYQDNQVGESCYLSPVYLGNTSIVTYLNVKTQVQSEIVLPDNFVTESQVIDLGDINKKQATLYCHTITLHNKTTPAYFTFSIDNTLQSEITKETLFNVLNGYVVVGTGVVQNILIDKISFRTTAAKTKVHQFASLGLSDYIDAEVTFEDIFETDYTLEDVTYPH